MPSVWLILSSFDSFRVFFRLFFPRRELQIPCKAGSVSFKRCPTGTPKPATVGSPAGPGRPTLHHPIAPSQLKLNEMNCQKMGRKWVRPEIG